MWLLPVGAASAVGGKAADGLVALLMVPTAPDVWALFQ